jgi:hypothetical protein
MSGKGKGIGAGKEAEAEGKQEAPLANRASCDAELEEWLIVHGLEHYCIVALAAGWNLGDFTGMNTADQDALIALPYQVNAVTEWRNLRDRVRWQKACGSLLTKVVHGKRKAVPSTD